MLLWVLARERVFYWNVHRVLLGELKSARSSSRVPWAGLRGECSPTQNLKQTLKQCESFFFVFHDFFPQLIHFASWPQFPSPLSSHYYLHKSLPITQSPWESQRGQLTCAHGSSETEPPTRVSGLDLGPLRIGSRCAAWCLQLSLTFAYRWTPFP